MELKVVCNDCGDELNIGLIIPELGTDSKDERTLKIQVNPCSQCCDEMPLEDEELDEESAKVKREIQDKLSADGEVHVDIIQPTVNNIDSYMKGSYDFKADKSNLCYEEIKVVLDAHPSIRNSIESCLKTRVVIRPNITATVHYLSKRSVKEDDNKPDVFMEKLKTGAGLKSDSAIRVLRDYFLELKGGDKRDTRYMLAHIIKAWNRYYQQDLSTKFSDIDWRRNGDDDEPMPQIINCPFNKP